MSQIYFNQRVSPRLYRTNSPPSGNAQEFFYENHLEDRLKELNHSNMKMLENIDELKDQQHEQKKQSRQIQSRLDHLFKLFTNKVNDIVTQITDIKHTNAKQNDEYIKNYETQQTLLQSIEEKQQKIEQHQIEDTDRNQSLFKEVEEKINELTSQVADIKNLSTVLTDTHQKDYEKLRELLEAINEKQTKFEENQHEEIDLTQLLFQELTKKINDIPLQINEIKTESASQTEILLKNHELAQAMLQSIDERQLKMEQRQRKDVEITQSFIQDVSEQRNDGSERATQNV